MKIMTLNLHTYQEDQQVIKFKRIAKKIVDEEIDVACFCQAAQTFNAPRVANYVRQDNAVKIICDEVNRLLGKESYRFAWDLSHYGFKIYEEGIAILTKHPVLEVVTKYISQTHDTFTFKSRKILKAVIDYHGVKINVFSCQLGWKDDEYEPFKEQFVKLNEWVRSEPESFSIIAGDFGNDVATECYAQIVDAGYVDQYLVAKPDGLHDETFINPRGFTTVHFASLRMDFIFTSDNRYPAISANRYFQSEEEKVSDHMAVMVDLDVPKEKETEKTAA